MNSFKLKVIIGSILGIILLIICIAWMIGCTNPTIPQGYVGYIYSKPIMFGQGGFTKLMMGPKKHGISWRKFVVNIDIRPFTVSENFKVLMTDKLNVEFKVHARFKIKNNKVKDLVEKYGTDFYKRFLREPFRTYVREEISKYSSWKANDNRAEIQGSVTIKTNKLVNETPFELQEVVVGNIDFPDIVEKAVELKMKTQQDLERKNTEIAITKKEAQIAIEEARGIAKSQEIINKTLTGAYLQYLSIRAQEKMASSPNHTTIYIPSGNNGIPLIKDIE